MRIGNWLDLIQPAEPVAVARAIAGETGLATTIKWPNDILLQGKKVAGILTELNAELDHIKYVILGIGVDVNLTPLDFPPDLRKIASSLKIETGHDLARAELAAAILRALEIEYGRIQSGHFPALREEWQGLCSTLGRNVSIRVGDRTARGRAESLDEDGALLLRTEYGRLERITGGDVTLAK